MLDERLIYAIVMFGIAVAVLTWAAISPDDAMLSLRAAQLREDCHNGVLQSCTQLLWAK